MIAITCYQTSDGVIHKSLEEAKWHAEERYVQLVSELAHEMESIDKYVKIADFIDGNVAEFVRLSELKKDAECLSELTE